MREGYFIGDLAKQVGMNPKTIRYYEDLGLLGAPERTESGYRLYGEPDLERLRFIQGAKVLGLTLAEVKEIIGVWSSGEAPCSRVSRVLDDKLEELDRRIAELTRFRDELRRYKGRVDAGGPNAEVPCAHIAGAAEGRFDTAVPEGLSQMPGRR